MAFTADQIADIQNSALELHLDTPKVFDQNIQSKPALVQFNSRAGSFSSGNGFVTIRVQAGQGGLALQGYTGDDQVDYGDPTGTKTVRYAWREHHIGMVVDMTQLKIDGIDVVENGADQEARKISGRDKTALANILDQKNKRLSEDYMRSLNLLLWGDGTADAKALAGIRSLILDSPGVGSTGGLSRVVHPWWRNRAATTAFAGAGGQGPITSSAANGGALIEFMDKEERQRVRYSSGSTRIKRYAGSDFIDAYKRELRANGNYSDTGWNESNVDGSMPEPKHNGTPFIYDPTLDDLGLAKRCYVIDIGDDGIRLMYLNGNKMKRHNPARPYDRYVMYSGITTTCVMAAYRLNTSAVYDIA